jgi:uncharacterized protein (TIGR04222 family)
MTWNHNILADLSGPHYLALYAFVIAGVFIWAALVRSALDPPGRDDPPPVPLRPDPYQIAYLRGGENEVTRAVLFGLVERGYLQVLPAKSRMASPTGWRISRAESAPDASLLSSLEWKVVSEFDKPRRAQDVFQQGVPARVRGVCADYEQALRAEALLTDDSIRQSTHRVAWAASAVILGLGVFKLAAALSNGHSNVGFLLLMMVVSLCILPMIVKVPRLSRRGRAYLERLQQAYTGLRRPRAISDPSPALDPLLLMVGVYGLPSLAGTTHARFAQMFPQSVSAGGGCGGATGGCGTSSGGGCGGGGCGGGCGGCGGG